MADTPVDVRNPIETFEHIRILLEQSTGLARVLRIAAGSGELLEEEMPASLDVLHGYCSTTLALFVRWQEAWAAEAKARRRPEEEGA
jgi:hypothetical protein